MLQITHRASMVTQTGIDEMAAHQERLHRLRLELDRLDILAESSHSRLRALLHEIGLLANFTMGEEDLISAARAVQLFGKGHGPEAHQFRGCVQALARNASQRQERSFADLSNADVAALQASCEHVGKGYLNSKACVAFAEAAQVMTRLAPPAWVTSVDTTCAFAVNFLLPAGEEPACMRVMHAVSLDVARKQRGGSLLQSAWPWVSVDPNFAKSFRGTCEKEMLGLDCVTVASQLQAMSSALVQQEHISRTDLPDYHRAACGAMQLTSTGVAASIEMKTHRAIVRRELEAALLAQAASTGKSQVSEVSLSEQKVSEGWSWNDPLKPPTDEQFNTLKKKVDSGWDWLYSQEEVRNTIKYLAGEGSPRAHMKEEASCEKEAYLHEMGSSLGAIASVGGSLGVGYGYDGVDNGNYREIQSGAYYTFCIGFSKGAGIEGVGIASSTMKSYGSIAGLSMVYSGSVCIGVCAGYSKIYCLPNPPATGHDYCGHGYLTGVGAKLGIGWETCYTKQMPDDVYKPTKEFISCGRRRRSWWL